MTITSSQFVPYLFHLFDPKPHPQNINPNVLCLGLSLTLDTLAHSVDRGHGEVGGKSNEATPSEVAPSPLTPGLHRW